MAPPHHQPNHLHPSADHLHLRRRCSKAQISFFNILHIISVFPAPDATNSNSNSKCFTHDDQISENHGFVVDLNASLRPPTAYHDAVGWRKSESEERATEHSEISHVGDQTSGIDYNEVAEVENKPRDEGYLGLLIEAAQLILADDSGHKTERKQAARGGARRNRRQCWTAAEEAEWYAEFEDTSPVVKSKRGRNQVLPFRYRDSVVEPLVRWTSPATSSCRSISNAAPVVPSKRRSR